MTIDEYIKNLPEDIQQMDIWCFLQTTYGEEFMKLIEENKINKQNNE